MNDLVERVNKAIADGEVVDEDTPLFNQAMDLLNDDSQPFAERLSKIYELADQAYAAGGTERERSSYIDEAMYAKATAEELDIIQQFNELT